MPLSPGHLGRPLLHRVLAALVVGAWLLAGCGTTAAPSVAPGAARAPAARPDRATVQTLLSVALSTEPPTAPGPPVPLARPYSRQGANPPSGLGFTYAAPGWVTSFHGRASGITARVVVWLPPEYAQPAYANQTFPVVQLLGGYPGNVFGWMHGLDVVSAYYRARAAGMPPAVLVATEISVAGRADLECLDAPGHPQVETWITRDVPAFMTAHFRVARPGGWGVMGFSMGGFCAPYLALTHPEVYRAAVAINGYLAASSAQLPSAFLARHSVLLAARARPAVSILWTTTHHDPNSPIPWGYQLQRTVAPPTQVTVEVFDSLGHATRQWSPYVASHLLWLVPRLPSS